MWNGSASESSNFQNDQAVVPSDILSPEISPAEQARQAMRTEHANIGWGTWENGNMLSSVLLPEGISLSLGFHRLSTRGSLNKVIVFRRDNPCLVYPGVHSYNFTSPGSVSQVSVFGWQDLNSATVTTMSGDHGELYISIGATALNLSDYVLVVSPQMLWNRQGNITVDPAKGMVEAQSVGLRTVRLNIVNGQTSPVHLSSSQFALKLDSDDKVLCADFGSGCPTGKQAAEHLMKVIQSSRQYFNKKKKNINNSEKIVRRVHKKSLI